MMPAPKVKQYTTGINLLDIEDAILKGQEEFITIMAGVKAEYLAPLMEQYAAMMMSQMTPDQIAQMQAQMQGASNGTD